MNSVGGKEKQLTNSAISFAFGAGRDSLIRETAHSLFQARNCVTGYALQDWLRAKALVNQMPGKAADSSG
jgi:hypothetical protein